METPPSRRSPPRRRRRPVSARTTAASTTRTREPSGATCDDRHRSRPATITAQPAAATTSSALASTPLPPDGFHGARRSRWTHPSTRMRELLATRPYLFGPGIYDPFGAQLVMAHGFDAVYFSGYSFAIGTSGPRTWTSTRASRSSRRPAARSAVCASSSTDRWPSVTPRRTSRAPPDIPPVVVDMDAGYGNIFNVQRIAELYVPRASRVPTSRTRCCPSAVATSAASRSCPRPSTLGDLRMTRADRGRT